MTDVKLKGQKAISAYFMCSWNTAVKHLKKLGNLDIFHYTIAKSPVLNVTKYEALHGPPRLATHNRRPARRIPAHK